MPGGLKYSVLIESIDFVISSRHTSKVSDIWDVVQPSIFFRLAVSVVVFVSIVMVMLRYHLSDANC